ncbi:adenylate/guanylate cyclase domain-containing protein [Aliiroseovarius sp. YM-037]|uniref:adenylate/guanylate cyclase domain-containing protein n=1 Tax=Aliiroseovarius sp. YM-037 TaxID=3341728 RepID=UPI003A80301D
MLTERFHGKVTMPASILRNRSRDLEKARNSVGAFAGYIWHGGPNGDGIPARVMAEIDQKEAAAERLIGWVQLTIVVFFATLYMIAPRAEGASGESFVPITLTAYFAFTVFRVILSYRVTLPGWYLVLSIIVDVMLLCGLIFSFHLQYMQPAAFYLKAPTMIYLFIFISLRALRFDPRFVLMAGLISVAGWLAMVVYALMQDMGSMHITRNYVDYITSNTILIGAEIDKSLTLLGVTIILSLALYRGRQMLFDSIQHHAAAEDLKLFFAPEVANSITSGDDMPSIGRCETRHAAILFIDVRSFTNTAETLPPNIVMEVLARYQGAALPEILRHNGRIDKFMGDGIMATFGAVHPSETYAADAMRAAASVIEVIGDLESEFHDLGWPVAFKIGAAVASGGVTVGVVGTQQRLEFTVIGNAVNLAAKLENANKLQQTRVLTDQNTYATAREQGYERADLPARDGVTIPGMSHPVDLVVVA